MDPTLTRLESNLLNHGLCCIEDHVQEACPGAAEEAARGPQFTRRATGRGVELLSGTPPSTPPDYRRRRGTTIKYSVPLRYTHTPPYSTICSPTTPYSALYYFLLDFSAPFSALIRPSQFFSAQCNCTCLYLLFYSALLRINPPCYTQPYLLGYMLDYLLYYAKVLLLAVL